MKTLAEVSFGSAGLLLVQHAHLYVTGSVLSAGWYTLITPQLKRQEVWHHA